MLRHTIALLQLAFVSASIQTTTTSSMSNGKFLYFGYGSNLLAKRILINNPTAIRKGAAKLPGYRLDFNGFASRWGGAVATIVPDETRHVWGALWEINSSDIDELDRQEGVESGIYKPIQVHVESSEDGGRTLEARSYEFIQEPSPSINSSSEDLGSIFQQIPTNRRPSPEYRRVIIIGAIETGLPQGYVDALEMIPHNDYKGSSGLQVIPLEEFHRSGPPATQQNICINSQQNGCA